MSTPMALEPGVLDWLLEPENPSARCLTLTRILGRLPGDREVVEARAAIPGWGPARQLLAAQWPDGYWMHPGVGYSPKHKATVWQVIFFAALGAPRVPAIARACTYVLDHARLDDGLFTADRTPAGAISCLGGNLLRAMLHFGCPDPRVEESVEVLAREAVQDEFRCRCNRRPRATRHRDGLPCAWGTIKVLGALAEVPADRRSPAMQSAIEAGVGFLLAHDLAAGAYPSPGPPSTSWQQLGFPLSYTSDILEALEVLLRLRPGRDRRLAPAIELVAGKRDPDGRWALEHTPPNRWASFGQVGRPNKWVTIRALSVLNAWEVAR